MRGTAKDMASNPYCSSTKHASLNIWLKYMLTKTTTFQGTYHWLKFQRCHPQFTHNSFRFSFLCKFTFLHHFSLKIQQNLLSILLHNTVVYKNKKKWATLVDTILSCSGSLVIFRCPRSITKTLLDLLTWQNKVCSTTCCCKIRIIPVFTRVSSLYKLSMK